MKDRTRDVVRQVGDNLVGRRHDVRQVEIKRIAVDESQSARLERVREPLAQECREASIELDGRHIRPGREQATSQETEPRPNLEEARPRFRCGLREDCLEDLGVGEEVLAERVACPKPGVLQRPPNGRRIDPDG